MKNMKFTGIRFLFATVLTFIVVFNCESQSSMPEVLQQGTISEQMNYIQEKTRIYEDFRAIREDMFQKLKNNATDSLRAAKNNIRSLQNTATRLNLSIDSLNSTLGTVRQDLESMTKTKNSIKLLGIEVNKTAYNSVMWIIIALLAGTLAIGFLAFKRNHTITSHTKKEFEELKKEFEAYRKASREAREKMSMAHFNELKRLRGG